MLVQTHPVILIILNSSLWQQSLDNEKIRRFHTLQHSFERLCEEIPLYPIFLFTPVHECRTPIVASTRLGRESHEQGFEAVSQGGLLRCGESILTCRIDYVLLSVIDMCKLYFNHKKSFLDGMGGVTVNTGCQLDGTYSYPGLLSPGLVCEGASRWIFEIGNLPPPHLVKMATYLNKKDKAS